MVKQKQPQTLVQLVLEGLTTDGAHHKQYYLEEILKALVVRPEELVVLHDEWHWEQGIAP
jgi:hypothetical protein